MQGFSIETLASADRTCHPDSGQKIHLKFIGAATFARFTTSRFDIEAKAPRLIASPFRIGQLGIETTNFIEHLDVGCGIGSGRTADGRLIDRDQFVELFESLNGVVLSGIAIAAI